MQVTSLIVCGGSTLWPAALRAVQLKASGRSSDKNNSFKNFCYKNNSCSRIFNARYQPISLINRQEASSIQAHLLNKPSAKINSIKFSSALEAKSPCSRHRTCASSYLNHSAIRLTLLSGNRQTAPANSQLAKPLSIVALSAAGEPRANLPISFDILRGTGAISTSQTATDKPNGITPARNLIVHTDAVKGRNNQLAHPIFLPPLATSSQSVKTVGGSQDVILTIPGLAGFAMKVKANSVTFPDGSRVGTLVVSPVTADKLPMAPPAGGAQFGVPAWTIQPAGTRFDPPIEVTLPNASSQPPGDNLPIVQWDHDLGQYTAMGRATVSEDGSVLVTDSGSGLTKAGWGGLCRYDPDKCGQSAPPKCSDCEQLLTGRSDCPTCYPDPSKNGVKCDGDICKTCQGGACKVDPSKDKTKIGDLLLLGSLFWEPKGFDSFSKSIGSKLGAEGSIKLKIGGVAKRQPICCAIENGESNEWSINGGGTVEGELKWNWVKGVALIKRYVSFGADDLGVYTKLKIFGGAATNLATWNQCTKDSTGKINIGVGGALDLIQATVSGTLSVNGAPVKIEFSPIFVNFSGGYNSSNELAGASLIKEKGTYSWVVTLKVSEYKFSDFKFILFQDQISGSGIVDNIVSFGAQ